MNRQNYYRYKKGQQRRESSLKVEAIPCQQVEDGHSCAELLGDLSRPPKHFEILITLIIHSLLHSPKEGKPGEVDGEGDDVEQDAQQVHHQAQQHCLITLLVHDGFKVVPHDRVGI